MDTSKTHSSDGFTLIEVLIALVVLTFGIMAVVGMFSSSIKGNAMGRHVTEATSLGQSQLDKLMTAVPYNNISSIYMVTPENLTGIDAVGEPGGFYNMDTEVEHITTLSGADVDMYLITVTVSWQGMDRLHEFKFQSLRAKDL